MPRPVTTYTTIFGETVTVPVRGKHYIEPRGYAARPGTGPAGETCSTCQHMTHKGTGARSYPACGLAQWKWTSGRASDILAKAPACQLWQAQSSMREG